MVDFSTYTRPGVYIDAGSTPTVAQVGVAPSVICLIGEGVGYHTFTETVSFGTGVSAVRLTKNGINPSSIVVTGYVADPSVSGQAIPKTFAADVAGSPVTVKDYNASQDISGGVANSITTLNKSSGSTMTPTYPNVTVSYRYTDADYYGLHEFSDFTSFQSAYGPAQDAVTGAIISPLSYAAQIAMTNGANQIFAIALSGTGTPQQQFADAYMLLSNSTTTVNLVVPLWRGVTDAVVLGGMVQTLNAALLADANSAVLRMAIVGLDQNYAGSATALATLAKQTPSNRIVMPWPNKFSTFNGYSTSTMTVDGFYMAAALAGLMSTRAAQEPLTKKYPQGFSGLPVAIQQGLGKADKDMLASSGVCVIETDRNGRLQVRHGLTTNYGGGVFTREISLVRQQDALYGLVQDSLDNAGLAGTAITANTPLQVKSIVSGALERAKSTGLIVDYTGLVVREQVAPSGDPTVIEVRFAYKPSYPLNYVLVSFSVDTSTGDSTLISPATTAITG